MLETAKTNQKPRYDTRGKIIHVIKEHEGKVGIKSYAKNMAHAMRLLDRDATVQDYRQLTTIGDCKYICHFSNASRPIVFAMWRLCQENMVTIMHDIIPRTSVIPISFYRWLLVYIVRKSKKVVVHTNLAKNMLIRIIGKKYGEKIFVIPHGTVINFNERKKKEEDDRIIFVTIGKVSKSSGILQTMQAFHLIRNSNIEWRIIGTCKDKSIMPVAKKDDRIRVLGFVDDREMHENLKEASGLIVNRVKSVGESSGSVAHALGYGIPILYPRVESIVEMVNGAGLCYENTIESKKEVLETFIKNECLRAELANKAQKVAENIEFAKTAKQILELI